MNKINVMFKKLDDRAKVPTYGSAYSAGADLYALCESAVTVAAGGTEFIHTGISLEIPEGVVGLIYARSGMACKRGVAPANKVGVIDSDYRGEIIVCLHNHGKEDVVIENGERVAQMVFAPYFTAEFAESKELSGTDRGEGGFGSTGTK
jgi:dUTP pyrophosphatase